MKSASMTDLAEAGQMQPFDSWVGGRPPAGWYPYPLPQSGAEFYKEHGFLVLMDALTSVEIQALREETTLICRGKRGEVPGLTTSTEAEADDDVLKKYLCIHFPHKISPPMFDALAHPGMVDVLTKVIGPNVKCMQSMLFVKSAGKPGQAWHQDEIYIPTRDRSLTGGWIALDDATVENGCLWVIPDSHRQGILYRQEWHDDRRFDCAHEARGYPWTDADAVPVEVKAGSIVFFNGYLLHRSLPNYATAGYRRSLVNHYMSAESFLPWGSFPPEVYVSVADNRDIVMIAGEDPYAHLGIADTMGAHVRSAGEGGCGNYQYNEAARKWSRE